jgi:nucleoside phosphorylase
VDNIGTEPATLNTYITLHHFKPHLCINAGTAGGFQKQGAEIGDVYFSTEAFRFHDRRFPIPGFDQYGIGSYPIYHLPKMIKSLHLKEGVVTTGSSLDYTDEDLKMMRNNNGAIKEMEAAGIAWTAHLLKTPLFALKAITDFVDSEQSTEEQFLMNLKIASQKLQIKTFEVLEYLETNLKDWTQVI